MLEPQDTDRKFIRKVHRFSCICFLNFFAFLAIYFYLGGDALNGKVEGGHYFLSARPPVVNFRKLHPRVRIERQTSRPRYYREVDEGIYTYSKLHLLSILITWPPMMFLNFLANRRKTRMNVDCRIS
jgi:hypothetical protein